MDKLFGNLEVSNSVKRNGFDLSSRVLFTAKAGELLPIYHKSVLPGDSFHISVGHFTRTAPVQTAAFSRIKEYFDWFFVPYRQLFKSAPAILTQNVQNPVTARSISSNAVIGTELPNIPSNVLLGDGNSNHDVLSILALDSKGEARKNYFGFNRAACAAKLFNFLGYNYTDNSTIRNIVNSIAHSQTYSANVPVSLFPLAAYQKIYYDFFRNTRWENMIPYNYNFDYLNADATLTLPNQTDPYWNSPTLFDLRYANYPKDLFMGLLPDSQFGDVSIVSLPDKDTPVHSFNSTGTNIGNLQVDSSTNNSVLAIDAHEGDSIGVLSDSLNFSVLDLRKAVLTQKYKEIIGSGSRDYQDLIKRVFDVDVPDSLADHCQYLGGDSSIINISEVVNQNLSDAASQPNLAGNGTGSNQGLNLNFTASEHGIIMCVYHACPIIDYSLNALNFDVTKTSVGDFANPVFDSLGYQGVPAYYLDNSSSIHQDQSGTILGYSVRYYDYKTSMDSVLGDFRETLQDWVSPLNTSFLSKFVNGNDLRLNFNFFQINPSILDPIFYLKANDYTDTDQLRISAQLSIQAIRNLSYTGLPY